MTPSLRRTGLSIGLVALTLALAAPPASAHRLTDDHGTLTAHDDPDGPPVIDVADCTVYFKADMEEATATFTLYQNRGRGGLAPMHTEEVVGTPDGEGGYSWSSDAITIDSEHSRYYAELVFGDEKTDTGEAAHTTTIDVHIHCGQPYVGCVQDITAEALEGGHVRLSWSEAHNATYYRVMRYAGDLPNGAPDFDEVGQTTGTTFVDKTTNPGETHYYRIAAWSEQGGGRGACRETVAVTAIPFFGAPLLGALALVGTVGAYAWLRRR